MTDHYHGKIEDLTPEDVIIGLQRNKKMFNDPIPSSYATLSEADAVAYDCWRYAKLLNNKDISPEEWAKNVPEEKRTKFITLLKEVYLFVKKEKEE